MQTLQWIILYPLIASFVCIKKPLKGDLLHWCIWWWVYVMVGIINCVVWWIPLIDTIQSTFLFIMYFPVCTDYFRKNAMIYYLKRCRNSFPRYLQFSEMYEQSKKLIKKALIYLIT